jgi:N-acetylglucosamine-6-sulfatase
MKGRQLRSHWVNLPLALVMACLGLLACGAPESTETPVPSPTSAPPAAPQGRCGDGVCDDAEQANPALCPQDCPAQTEPAAAAPETPTLPAATAPSEPAGPPNIVFILTDDLDYAALEYMPKLKSLLVDQGLTLSNFYISMPLCCPSRATILRGQYGHNTQIMGNDLPFGGYPKFAALGEEESTIATWLQAAGYRTMLAGKYLNAFPDRDDLMHIPPGWTEWYSPVDGVPYAQYDYTLNENGQQVVYGDAPEDYGTDVYARKTLDFIQRSMAEGQPFFAHVSVYAPHWPTTPAPRHANLFPDATAPRTPNFNEADTSDKPSYISGLPLLTEQDIARIDEDWRNRLRSMQAVDELIESVVDTLESARQLDNTYIFFTSDNGYHFGNHRQLLGKTSPYEEEIRVTMIIRGPGVPADQTLDHLAGNTDLAPTWAEIAGVALPDFVDGRSLLPLFSPTPPPLTEWRQCFLIEHAPYELPGGRAAAAAATNTPEGVLEPPDPEDEHPSGTPAALTSGTEALPYRGIRTPNYVYIEYPTGEQELYDLRNDPYQLENLAATAPAQLRAELAARLEEMASCSGASCRTIEDRSFASDAASAPEPVQAATPEPAQISEPLIYYLGYATPDNMTRVEEFDVDVLVRGFLLFLNSSDAWLSDYGPRLEQCQDEGRQFLVGLQAAVLVEDAKDLPRLSPDDPALAYPMEAIPAWEEFACQTPPGATLLEAQGQGFAHACLNNPAFREFLKDKLRAVIDSGADGIHIDELQTRYFAQQEGYCDACLDGFRDYLAARYSPAELQEKYNIASIASFDFRQRLADEGNLDTPPESPLHGEWWLFQLTSLKQAEAELVTFCKSVAREERTSGEFLVNANSYEPEQNPDRALEMTLTDFATIGTGMTIRLRKAGRFVSESRTPPAYSYLPLYRMAQGLTPDKPVTLFIDGPGGTNTMNALPQQQQRDIIRWMFAEAYAAGARFHIPYPSLDYYAPLEDCQQYVRFIRDNRKMYEGVEPLAEVGVLFSYASEIWDYWVQAASREPNHNRQYYGLAQALTDTSVQYDAVFAPDGNVIEDNLTLDDLMVHPRVIVPWAYALSDRHVQLLQEYASSGKELILIGDFATFDEERNPRATDAAATLAGAGAAILPGPDFEAYLADPQGTQAAHVQDFLASLVPDRLVTSSNSSVTVQLNRNGNTMYCHLINKERSDSGFRTQSSFQVTISPPSDLSSSATHVIYRSPDIDGGAPARLPIVRQNGSLQVTVPELQIYGVLAIPAAD